MTLTLRQITDALHMSRARVEQWISRGHFRPPQEPILGSARDWEIDDAIRLALMDEMLSAGMTAQQAGYLVYFDALSVDNEENFFVAFQSTTEMQGVWDSKVVSRRNITDLVADRNVPISLVINLDLVKRRVIEALKSES